MGEVGSTLGAGGNVTSFVLFFLFKTSCDENLLDHRDVGAVPEGGKLNFI